jgi:multicomponent Na+:H+ antiporter subunit E
MNAPEPRPAARPASAIAGRFALLFGLWLVLGAGTAPADLVVGLGAAALATAVSLRLLPPGGHGLRPLAMLRLAAAIIVGAARAGVDIARRAFDPALPIRPGEVAVPLALPPGPARDGFRLLSSLQPGTLPIGEDAAGRLLIHALDTGQPVAAETRAAEALFAAATGRVGGHG